MENPQTDQLLDPQNKATLAKERFLNLLSSLELNQKQILFFKGLQEYVESLEKAVWTYPFILIGIVCYTLWNWLVSTKEDKISQILKSLINLALAKDGLQSLVPPINVLATLFSNVVSTVRIDAKFIPA